MPSEISEITEYQFRHSVIDLIKIQEAIENTVSIEKEEKQKARDLKAELGSSDPIKRKAAKLKANLKLFDNLLAPKKDYSNNCSGVHSRRGSIW